MLEIRIEGPEQCCGKIPELEQQEGLQIRCEGHW